MAAGGLGARGDGALPPVEDGTVGAVLDALDTTEAQLDESHSAGSALPTWAHALSGFELLRSARGSRKRAEVGPPGTLSPLTPRTLSAYRRLLAKDAFYPAAGGTACPGHGVDVAHGFVGIAPPGRRGYPLADDGLAMPDEAIWLERQGHRIQLGPARAMGRLRTRPVNDDSHTLTLASSSDPVSQLPRTSRAGQNMGSDANLRKGQRFPHFCTGSRIFSVA